MEITVPTFVREIMDRLEEAGYEAFAVGGSLRDIMLGKEPHDWDLTTSAMPEAVASLFPDKHVIPTGIKHGTVTVVTEGNPIEITTYRVDGEYTDSRRPDSVIFTRNVEDDLSRRDFTVNAMAYSEKRGLVDLFGGKTDLEKKIVRAVGDPEKRFTEDALRIMRAFRFSAQLGFEIEENTLNAAKKLSKRLENIAKERIGSEFLLLLASEKPSTALSLMGDTVYEILPVTKIDRERYALADRLGDDAVSRLSLILYGKSEEELLCAAHALRLSNEIKRRMILLATPTEEKFEPTPLSARRFLRRYGDVWRGAARILTQLCEASAGFEGAVEAEAAKNPCLSVGGLAIGGGELISLGIAKGRAVGELLSALLDEVIRDPSLNETEKLIALARTLQVKI